MNRCAVAVCVARLKGLMRDLYLRGAQDDQNCATGRQAVLRSPHECSRPLAAVCAVHPMRLSDPKHGLSKPSAPRAGAPGPTTLKTPSKRHIPPLAEAVCAQRALNWMQRWGHPRARAKALTHQLE